MFFFFNDTATTEIYTLSLHDALPISARCWSGGCPTRSGCRCRPRDRKSTRLNSSHLVISYAVFCLKKKKQFFYFVCPGFWIVLGIGISFVQRNPNQLHVRHVRSVLVG